MDEEQQLLFQERLLNQELELIKAKLQYVRMVKHSEHQKDNLVPSSEMSKTKSSPVCPATGKDLSNPVIAGNSLTVTKEVQTSTTDNSNPSLKTSEKLESSPELTASNLVTSNPLMAESLPKTLERPLEINLRPNGGFNPFNKSVAQAPVSEQSEKGISIPGKKSKPHYVVFNGPNAGIYETWPMAKAATEGVSGIHHKKYKNFLEAHTAASIYRRTEMLPELHLHSSSEGLRPKRFVPEDKTEKKKHTLPQKIITEEPVPEDFQYAGFEHFYQAARRATEKELIEERYFTTDGNNLSYYNFVQNADPLHVFEAFSYGLVRTIYPSNNLLELQGFPKAILKSIKKFRSNCIKDDRDIFLKIQSSIPFWDEHEAVQYTPHHIIQIGISSGNKYSPSTAKDCVIGRADLAELVCGKLGAMVKKVFGFTKEDRYFVNHQDKKYLVISSSFKGIEDKDEQKILSFQKEFKSGLLLGTHFDDVCKIIQKQMLIVGQNYSCSICDKNNARPDESSQKDHTEEMGHANDSYSTDDSIM